MKKTRNLMAFTVTASIALSMALPVYGYNAPGRFATGTPMSRPIVEEEPERITAEQELTEKNRSITRLSRSCRR